MSVPLLPPPLFGDGTPLTLDRLAVKARNLTLSPAAARILGKLASGPDVDARAVAKLVERDPALAVALLRLSAEAAEPARRLALHPEQLVTLVGAAPLAALAGAADGLRVPQGPASPYERELRHHMVRAGVCARVVSRYTARVDPDVAFLAGMLLDIGQLVLCLSLPLQYAELLETAALLRAPVERLETEWLGYSHAEVGFLLAERWRLPPVYGHAIGLQHQLDAGLSLLDEKETAYVAAAALGADLADAVRRQEPPDDLSSHIAQRALALDAEVLSGLFEECRRASFEVGLAETPEATPPLG